jgi:hypothetical protein
MRKNLLLLILFVLSVQNLYGLKISDFYRDVKVGQWILMKSSDGLLTRTAIVAKGDGRITLNIKSYQDEKLVSDSEQIVDVEQGRILSVRINDQGVIKEIKPEKTDAEDFFQIDFRPSGSESIAVEKGLFNCKRYKGIYKDRVVRAWINDEVPILHLVKIRMQGVAVELVDYGD